eukprot:scaffold13741_cov96-Isochrysis_galbana.AAC.1
MVLVRHKDDGPVARVRYLGHTRLAPQPPPERFFGGGRVEFVVGSGDGLLKRRHVVVDEQSPARHPSHLLR